MEQVPTPTMADIIIEDFLRPLHLTVQNLIDNTNIDEQCLYNVLKGTGKIDETMAICLCNYLGQSVDFWLEMQELCDLRKQGRYDILNAGIEPLPESVPS